MSDLDILGLSAHVAAAMYADRANRIARLVEMLWPTAKAKRNRTKGIRK